MKKIKFRSGFVSILGPANSGKSTLINRVIGKKVSIVSNKVQTTRFSVRGVLNLNIEGKEKEKSQIIFIDTPGIFKPKRNLDKVILNNAIKNIKDSDHNLLIYDSKKNHGLDEFNEALKNTNLNNDKTSLVLNKIDLVEKKYLLNITDKILSNTNFSNVFMISAKNGDGCYDLINFLAKKMPEGNFLYDEKFITNLPNQMLASEITREKLFKKLGFELPYNLFVKTIDWNETSKRIKIFQNIFVSKTNHKMIIIGEGGQNIKKIGIESRTELEQVFEKKIHLFLFVKVKKNWINVSHNSKFFGLDFNV